MNAYLLRLPLLILLVTTSILAAQKRTEDWLPFTPAELQMKESPGGGAASAVQLYYAHYEDHNTSTLFIYQRIKVLNENGRSYANVEIPFVDDSSYLEDLKARTIQPDGRIVEFRGKPFEKTVVKARGVSFLAKAFTLPEVNVGSIIEYKYRLRWQSRTYGNTAWTLQRDLFTVRASFYFNPYRGPRQVSFVQNLAGVDYKPTVKDGAVEMELSNIPAFDREEYSPPEAEIKPQIRFHYGGAEVSSPERFWANAGKLWYEAIEKFIGNDKEIREAAQQLVAAENDPEKKLRILYSRAQQVRNLSYERRRTQQEEKKEKLKDNDNAADVFKRGYGHRWDINRLFVALARRAGFEARVVRVAERDDHFFDKNMLSYSQFDGELAVVNLNAKDIYLDPGTRFCPFGAVRWTRTSVTGRSLDKNGGSFFITPLPGSDAALTRRDAEFTLDEQGRLAGRITVQLSGQEAMNRRISALYMDESGRKQDFEDDLKSWLPVGAEVKLEKSMGWESSEQPLVAEFSVNVPDYASIAGKRLLLPTGIFQAQQKNPFPHPLRKHPVYFAYPYRELDNIGIKLPESLALERLPRGQSQTFPHGRIRVMRKANGNELLLTREFQVDGVLFPTEDYFGLRDLFNKLQSVDEEQAILRRTESTTAGASN